MKRQDIWLLLAVVFLVILQFAVADDEGGGSHEAEDEEGIEPHVAILFPWFIEITGVLVFFFATRYFKVFPYTAIMFLIGTFMGIAVNREGALHDQLSESTRLWEDINSEVLLLVFLPGLIFHDAYSLNVHLFQVSFVQCLIMAFPMVLAGTVLTALIGFYIFPYGWSFNLAMTFGSILSATDPVAVSALLSEVGAPPRLKMHISGESLLNDGSAIVFFTIFAGLFLYEIDPDVGNDVTVGEGFAIFFRMALGGACIGTLFGVGLVLILYLLNRRLSQEENVLQVASTITVAYLCYYVADAIAGTSGVISVVFCGVFTKAYGASLINDLALMENFWVLVEHLLNTVLFALGGAVWGSIIANADLREFRGADWGYLILLYVLLIAIRFFLVFAFYPILSRIGLKTNLREAVFLSYGGLRGAVGISLAIALDDEVFRSTSDAEFRAYSTKLFGMVGGIAFLTLFINGTTAGMVLKKLGLASGSEDREKLVEHYYESLRVKMIDAFVHLLTDPLFADVDFALVSHHVPFLATLTPDELKDAVIKNKESVPAKDYHKPALDGVLPYLLRTTEAQETAENFDVAWAHELGEYEKQRCLPRHLSERVRQTVEESDLTVLQAEYGSKPETRELRLVFLEILKAAYNKQIEKGYIDVRAGSPGFVAFTLQQGIEFAIDGARNGQPMNDWDASFLVSNPIENHGKVFLDMIKRPLLAPIGKKLPPKPSMSNQRLQFDVNRAISFLEAHKLARQIFEEEFCSDSITECEKTVVGESLAESKKAEAFVKKIDEDDVKHVLSHILCLTLLNKASRFVALLAKRGLLKEQEASEKVDEIEADIEALRRCAETHHPGELSQYEKDKIMENKDV